MSEELLRDRDYTLILSRNGKFKIFSPPELEQQWEIAEKTLLQLAKKCETLNREGLTVYLATDPIQVYQHQTSQSLAKLLEKSYYLHSEINLALALEVALQEHLQRKISGTSQKNGEIIIVVLDSEPPRRSPLIKLLVALTQRIDSRQELGIVFAQVGGDMITKGFLTALDDDLTRAGAKFDIVDAQIFRAMDDRQMTEFLLNALSG